mmetsp:Transcript_68340/g.158590  ORF Transcript_68340/g.158590 Transcript_68340/m.158590 type:complete len:241 (+) Transcript_68340:637-1359(+)
MVMPRKLLWCAVGLFVRHHHQERVLHLALRIGLLCLGGRVLVDPFHDLSGFGEALVRLLERPHGLRELPFGLRRNLRRVRHPRAGARPVIGRPLQRLRNPRNLAHYAAHCGGPYLVALLLSPVGHLLELVAAPRKVLQQGWAGGGRLPPITRVLPAPGGGQLPLHLLQLRHGPTKFVDGLLELCSVRLELQRVDEASCHLRLTVGHERVEAEDEEKVEERCCPLHVEVVREVTGVFHKQR